MRNPTLLRAYRDNIQRLSTEMTTLTSNINSLLRGTDVIIGVGKYSGRRAQIQDYYFDHGKEYLHVFIYRVDNRVGFNGKEDFIDDHNREFLELEDCYLVLE